MLSKDNGHTICSLCRSRLHSADDSRRHRSDHTLQYWARQPGWDVMYSVLWEIAQPVTQEGK